jgi:glycine/D-amino acid oxidase-like deaminating enzyme/nitrite reductase/ring-hydroxylating ferredoxin subunit
MKSFELPHMPKSYWREQQRNSDNSSLEQNISTDILIVGAGIVGATAAYLLAKEGANVTVIEGSNIASGTTGFTTAKVTAQHGPIYHQLIKNFGEEKAKLYYQANQEALENVRNLVQTLSINCDFEERDAVLYAEFEEGKQLLREEKQAYDTLEILGDLSSAIPSLPFSVEETLSMPNQAQFHPVKYVYALVEEAKKLGVTFYEHTRAMKVKNGETVTVELMNGYEVEAKQVIVSSHFPFNDEDGLYFTRLAPNRSYVVCAKVSDTNLNGMYINVEKPTRSIRTARGDKGETYVLVGGEGHKTGQNKVDTTKAYETLANFAKQNFSVESIDYHWSAQDPATLDKIPYVGQAMTGMSNIFVATGFDKWGMTNGTNAAYLLKDLCLDKPNPYQELFDPTRSKMKMEDAKNFIKENSNVAKELVKGKFIRPSNELDEIQLDEGKIVMVDQHKTGAYRDHQGHLHLVKPTCTHMGCDVNWNDAERSWDCPCHGSRFSYKGEVLEGPAVEPLHVKHISEENN